MHTAIQHRWSMDREPLRCTRWLRAAVQSTSLLLLADLSCIHVGQALVSASLPTRDRVTSMCRQSQPRMWHWRRRLKRPGPDGGRGRSWLDGDDDGSTRQRHERSRLLKKRGWRKSTVYDIRQLSTYVPALCWEQYVMSAQSFTIVMDVLLVQDKRPARPCG